MNFGYTHVDFIVPMIISFPAYNLGPPTCFEFLFTHPDLIEYFSRCLYISLKNEYDNSVAVNFCIKLHVISLLGKWSTELIEV